MCVCVCVCVSGEGSDLLWLQCGPVTLEVDVKHGARTPLTWSGQVTEVLLQARGLSSFTAVISNSYDLRGQTSLVSIKAVDA